MLNRDLWLQRYRVADTVIPPSPDLPQGAGAFVGQVANTGTVTVGQYLTVHPVTVGGDTEAEGLAGGFVVDTGHAVRVLLVGPGVPANGDYVVCRYVGNRWAAERKGTVTTTGRTIPPCPCTNIPDTMYMHCNPPPGLGIANFMPCTITWQPLPSDLVGYHIPDPGYYSEVEYYTGTVGVSYHARQWFSCQTAPVGYFAVALPINTDPSYTGGSGGNPILFIPGATGNTCSPWVMSNGNVSGGGNPQSVRIDTVGPP